jgi:hypothetical protein
MNDTRFETLNNRQLTMSGPALTLLLLAAARGGRRPYSRATRSLRDAFHPGRC